MAQYYTPAEYHESIRNSIKVILAKRYMKQKDFRDIRKTLESYNIADFVHHNIQVSDQAIVHQQLIDLELTSTQPSLAQRMFG